MNVGHVCKQIPAYLPHELFGFDQNSLPGMLLTIDILSKVNDQEAEASSEKNVKQHNRYSKFKKNK